MITITKHAQERFDERFSKYQCELSEVFMKAKPMKIKPNKLADLFKKYGNRIWKSSLKYNFRLNCILVIEDNQKIITVYEA